MRKKLIRNQTPKPRRCLSNEDRDKKKMVVLVVCPYGAQPKIPEQICKRHSEVEHWLYPNCYGCVRWQREENRLLVQPFGGSNSNKHVEVTITTTNHNRPSKLQRSEGGKAKRIVGRRPRLLRA